MSTINREDTIAELMKMPKPLVHWEEVRKMLEAMPEEKMQLSEEDATFCKEVSGT